IIVRRKAGAPLMHAGLYVLGGACNESADLAGLTTLMVRTAVKGTQTRGALQIAEEAEMLGGSVSGFAGSDSFGWSISVPARYAAAAIELVADVAQYPSIEGAALETERAIAVADVVAQRDDMYRYPMRLASQAAFAGHAYGSPVGGTEETLARVTADQVRAWHASSTIVSPAVIALVGDRDPDELAAIAARAFHAIEHAGEHALGRALWPSSVSMTAESRDRAQTALAMLFPGPARGDDDRFAAHLIATVASGLGGRFFDELRDKRSLCYTVNLFTIDRRAAGAFAAYIATSPAQESAARDGLLAELARLRDEPVRPDELDRARTYTLGTHAIRQQNGGAVLADIVDAYLFGTLRELDDYESNVRAVTAESMVRVARRYFDAAIRVEGIVRGVAKSGLS
ncbi:MAG: M16 family metallopeptidase, partial [Gemmatimonadaceae bacterium]